MGKSFLYNQKEISKIEMKKFEVSVSISNSISDFELNNTQKNFEIEISISISVSISTKIFEILEIFRFRPASMFLKLNSWS